MNLLLCSWKASVSILRADCPNARCHEYLMCFGQGEDAEEWLSVSKVRPLTQSHGTRQGPERHFKLYSLQISCSTPGLTMTLERPGQAPEARAAAIGQSYPRAGLPSDLSLSYSATKQSDAQPRELRRAVESGPLFVPRSGPLCSFPGLPRLLDC